MARGNRWWFALALAWLAGLLLVAAPPASAQQAQAASCTAPTDILQARREVWESGKLVASEAVAIPDSIPRAWRAQRFQLRYRVETGACPAENGPRALLFFRVGGPYSVTADGVALEPLRPSGHEDPPYNGRTGGSFILPHTAASVDVVLATLPNVSGGLIRVVAGPQGQVLAGPGAPHHRWQQFNLLISMVLGIVGVLALLAAMVRRFDKRVAWFAATCLLWAVRGQLLQLFAIPIDPYVFEQLNPIMLSTAAVLVNASTLALAGGASPWHARVLQAAAAFIVLGFAATLSMPSLALPYRTACYASGYLLLIWAVVTVSRRRSKLQPAYARWLMAGYISVMLGGSHDILMVMGLAQAGWWTLLTPGFTLLLLCHLVVVGLYLLQNLQRAERANEELEHAIAARSLELQASYALRQALELEQAGQQAKEAERRRMVRDMHDGLGSQLMAALRGVERGALAPPQLVQALQDSLDELRLLMDSTDMDGYLPGALGAWRNRWGARLAAAGVELRWQVDDSLDEAQLAGDVTLQVMRILQEATTNILKHSQARVMTVSARVEGAPGERHLLLEVLDDGVGLQEPAGTASRRGLKNMHFRATQVGARLDVQAMQAPVGGTQVLLRLPLAA